MTVEKKLQDYILNRYNSIREFTQAIEMPYSTFATILARGVDNANVLNIIKICQGLGISTDALADGRIVPVTKLDQTPDAVADIMVEFSAFEARVLTALIDKIVIDGEDVTIYWTFS